MKKKITLFIASVTLAITGITLKASAVEAHTQTSNFNEYRLSNTTHQQNIGRQKTPLLSNKDASTLKADNSKRNCRTLRCVIKKDIRNIKPGVDVEQKYVKNARRRSGRGVIDHEALQITA